MITSTTIKTIAPALLEAQKKIGAATKNAENPFFHSDYADLGSVMEACKEILNENGITVLQPIGSGETGAYVETVLLHTSGEYIADRMPIAAKSQNNPQDQGSAISYARRYSLQSMCFIPAKDDDAEKATDHTPANAAQSTRSVDDEEWMRNNSVSAETCDTCGADATIKSGANKATGKPWKGKFCSADKAHVKWMKAE